MSYSSPILFREHRNRVKVKEKKKKALLHVGVVTGRGLRAEGLGVGGLGRDRGIREERQLRVERGEALPLLVLFQKKPKVSIVID